ncbi:DNA damage-regulated autophagy modulator protein 2-like [Convolutriloba macropyga]|uniref:DNA damage-regulated autophagy modulator protein 2-like n=1 Tax=Convolutriloba macropyga TaxID=536237 RepID=UPI003F51DFAE
MIFDRMGLGYLSILAFSLAMVTFITSYSISQAKDLVVTRLPFISDTGTLPPASCWFGLLLNATAYTFLIVVIVRFLQIREQLGEDRNEFKWINWTSLGVGVVGSVGMSMVACFQETNVLTMHLVGAFAAFISATVYGFMHCYLTYALIENTSYNHKGLLVIRVLISITCLCTLVSVVISNRFSGYRLPPYVNGKEPYTHKGWYYAATVSEWTLAISFFVYILTLTYEFSTVKITAELKTVPGNPIFTPKEANQTAL